VKFPFLFILLFITLAQAQIFIPFSYWKGTLPFSVIPSPLYVLAGDSTQLTAIGGMGIYNWTITGPATSDGALIDFTPTNPVADYDARLTSYAPDTITISSPGSGDVTVAVTTYDPIGISPKTVTVGVGLSHTFTATGGCLNGASCVGGSYFYSMVSGAGSIDSSTGVYTAPPTVGTNVVQVQDSIGNTDSATITLTNSLTISPPTLKIPIYSTHIFSAILGSLPYTFSVPFGTGSFGCQSTLNGAHTISVATITVLDTTGCPLVGSINVGSEIICYTNKTATTFTGAIRGCNSTTAAAYASGTAYNSAQAVYTAPSMIGAATLRVTDASTGSSDASISIIKPIDVKTGQYLACVLYDEGSVKCWGLGGAGRLGIGSTATIGDSGIEVGGENEFVNLGTGRTAKSISVATAHACVILDDNTTKCWGNGGSGRLGNGSTSNLGDTPSEMGDGLPIIDVGTGRYAKEIYTFTAHTCAILDNNSTKCWGQNTYGQLGYGDTSNIGNSPGQMGDNLDPIDLGTGLYATKLAGGLDYTCALLNNGSVKCWGRNRRGQLGKDNTTSLGINPGEMGDALTAVDLGTSRTAIDIIGLHETVCVQRDNNTMICWGRNNNGQAGKGATGGANSNIGDQSGEMAAIASINMNTGFGTLAKIYGLGQSACAEDTLNVVKCWGNNAFGQLLLGNSSNQNTPQVTASSFGTGLVISKLYARFNTACALFTNDRIKCWGRARTGTAGVVNGVLLNGSVENSLGDAAGELGDSLPYINH
jgi:hypothetical protein